MDDIQNLLYFAFLIIWFLWRAFSGGKKKKNQKQHPTPPLNQPANYPESTSEPAQPVTFEDILRELSGAPPREAPKPQSVPESTYHEEEEASFEDVYGRSYQDDPKQSEETTAEYSSGHPDYVIEGGFKEFAIKRNRGSKVARDVRKLLRKPGGLKKAIVLKEILDRKY